MEESDKLIEELIAVGRKPTPDRRSSSYFLSQARSRTEEIGERLNAIGDLELMQSSHAEVARQLGGTAARELEAAWGGIGDWES